MLVQSLGMKGFAILRNLQSVRGMPRFLMITRRQMNFVSVNGWELNEQQKTVCRRYAKRGWKHYPVGVGVLTQIIGKKAFAILRILQSVRGIQKLLEITKRLMDIELVSG